ncbi:MAG: DUF5016 domain-containing protein [Dysgonamonadaceae bacterium]|jgi:hypothetical protein|nr:DUF5016 domain-containing protein [Dysgonamonadaceae bacterium]
MKILKLFIMVILAGIIVSCSEDENNSTVSIPVIESLNIQENTIQLGDSIYFDAKLTDAACPLSTLEVELTLNNVVLNRKSIRTKGNSVKLENTSLFVPFLPNIATGDEFKVNFTLINVDGNETKEQKTIRAVRPDLPETLYLVLSDKSVIELYANPEDPYIYKSTESNYPSMFSAKIATSEDLAEAEYIWNAGANDNTAAIGDRFGSDAKFSYNDWMVKKIIFDAFSFTFDKEGSNLVVKINDIRLVASGDYLYTNIELIKGNEYEIQGIENLQQAYNRDFFEYNQGTGKCKFIGESGKWDVYYSLAYNYLWINRMSDIAPAAYWIIGAGLSSAPRWHTDFNSLGWSLNDVKQIAYMRSLGSGKYQACVYLSEQVAWGFDIQISGNRGWNVINYTEDSLTGDTEGIIVHPRTMADIVMGDGYIPGYFRITLDTSQGMDKIKVNLERLP